MFKYLIKKLKIRQKVVVDWLNIFKFGGEWSKLN